MSEKYIRQNRSSYTIIKGSKNYGNFKSIEDAILIRNLLVKNDWNLNIGEIHFSDDNYIITAVIDEKIHVVSKCRTKPSQNKVNKLINNYKRNPNRSRYGLNISKIFDTFIIKKRIAGDDYIFGYYDKIEDAEFVRNFLMDNSWNVNEFRQIEYDAQNDNHKVVEVIDDKIYVLKTFEGEIDLDRVHEEFLAKITKHKLGLSMHPHLDELKSKVSELEERFNVNPKDDYWALENTQNPLEDIVFTLTPFQKSVYDAVDDSTVEDIEKALVRFKTKNFTEKIMKNLDELVKLGLIDKNQNHYIRLRQ